jgi:ankyrin repeat protein
MRGDSHMVLLLLRFGADGNIRNSEFQKTPLHYAVELCYNKIVELLISHEASPLVADREGKTSLDFALTPEI